MEEPDRPQMTQPRSNLASRSDGTHFRFITSTLKYSNHEISGESPVRDDVCIVNADWFSSSSPARCDAVWPKETATVICSSNYVFVTDLPTSILFAFRLVGQSIAINCWPFDWSENEKSHCHRQSIEIIAHVNWNNWIVDWLAWFCPNHSLISNWIRRR